MYQPSLDLQRLYDLREKTGFTQMPASYSPPQASSGGMNFSGMGGAAGTGATIGAGIGSIVPGVGTLLGGAIGAGAGALFGAVGAGMEGEEAKKEQRRKEAIEQQRYDDQKKMQMLQYELEKRGAGLEGLNYLANQRAMAMKQFRGQQLRDGVLKSLGAA